MTLLFLLLLLLLLLLFFVNRNTGFHILCTSISMQSYHWISFRCFWKKKDHGHQYGMSTFLFVSRFQYYI